MMDETKYVHWLAALGALPVKEKIRLCRYFGNERHLYAANSKQLARIPGIKPTWVQAILEHKKHWELEREYEKLACTDIGLVAFHQKSYPESLRQIYDLPYCLYVKGRLPDPEKKAVAIVGARMCSAYGREAASLIGKQLGAAGVEVISGLALGVDGAAQRGALVGGGTTYGVMGCGVDVCYPSANRSLYQDVMKQGGILSENVPGTPPRPFLFPQRNRIISALSDAVILVEAREKSGSLITADCALEQGKEIYALPGRMGDDLSQGTNRLIAQGAAPFLSVEEFLKDMGVAGTKKQVNKKLIEILLEKNEWLVYSVLDLTPRNIDWLMVETGLSLKELLKVICSLQESGYIKEAYHNYYIKSLDR